IEIRVVCDTWRQKREAAAAQVKEHAGNNPAQAIRYQEVLNLDDIDAVIIGTPDHLHAKMLADAARAGKDVYVEKPIAMNMDELIEAVDAVKKHKRVVQVGTQMRSYPQSAAARRLVTSGKLGKILKVEQARNSYEPYWQGYGGEKFFSVQPTEADVDWEAFLMGREPRPFSAVQYR
ncbi:MAG: Gfo/Idh/MocA family oxidoreductase, partial [bacterium]|nr:Gfo/Idh/MocA family oxidoreductase [bacterium]